MGLIAAWQGELSVAEAQQYPRVQPRPAAFRGGYPAEYDEAEYDDGYDNEFDYDEAPMPARRRRLEDMRYHRPDAMLEARARVQQPAGIDRDDNGVVGDFDGEPGENDEVEGEEGDDDAELMTPDGKAVGGEEGSSDEAPAEGETVEAEVGSGGSGDGEAPSKLELALGAIKEDIMKKSRQVGEEMTWIDEVDKITTAYKEKSKRVSANVEVVRGEVKDLYKKKKQIENLILQKELQAKLGDANEDLGTLEKALGHVKTKEEEFVKTKTNIQDTISGISKQLEKLEGKTDESVGEKDEEEEIEKDIESEV